MQKKLFSLDLCIALMFPFLNRSPHPAYGVGGGGGAGGAGLAFAGAGSGIPSAAALRAGGGAARPGDACSSPPPPLLPGAGAAAAANAGAGAGAGAGADFRSWCLRKATEIHPDTIVMKCGGNDFAGGVKISFVLKCLKDLAAALSSTGARVMSLPLPRGSGSGQETWMEPPTTGAAIR